MSTQTVPFRWWHIPQVVQLERELFPEDAWSPEQFWQELAQPTRSYVVVETGDEVVAYAGAFITPPDADVQTVAVRASAQGHGLGRALVERLLEEMARRGARQALLEVRADNASALRLYERLGFERIAQRSRYYPDGGDALIMRRSLAPGESS